MADFRLFHEGNPPNARQVGAAEVGLGYMGARGLAFNTVYDMANIAVTATGAPRAVRLTLPAFSADENGRGSTPGLVCYVRVNGVDYFSNQIFVPHDKYGNGLSFGWTPQITLQIPANTTNLHVQVHVTLLAGMRNLVQHAGYVWADIV